MSKKSSVSARDIVIKKPVAANDAADVTAPSATVPSNTKPIVLDDPTATDPLTVPSGNTKPGDFFEVLDGIDEPNTAPNKASAESTGASSIAQVSQGDAFQTDSATGPLAHPNALAIQSEKLPFSLLRHLDLVVSATGRVHAEMKDQGNRYCLPVGSKPLNHILRQLALAQGVVWRKSDFTEANEMLTAYAEMVSHRKDIWYRVAKIDNGIEIDLGDDQHTRVRITPGRVETITQGSDTLFFRSSTTLPFVKPAEKGDLQRISKYLNMDGTSLKLFIAWLTYTLAHPKLMTAAYVFLVLKGDQGSGKSFVTKLIHALIDPNSTGVRILPRTGKDLAIALANTHVASFDNVRGFSPDIADLLCVAATGGALPSRRLYTDDTEHVQHLHGAVVLNGIHSFVTQPDLAQRCLTIQLKPIKPDERRSESDLIADFEADLPVILRGLFDYIAKVLEHYPDVEMTNPERMVDYVRWLAAMEKADSAPAGVYQALYSEQLHDAELETLLDNPLAFAMVELAQSFNGTHWSGTPTELYDRLCFKVSDATQRSKYWPSNPIAMSKRLTPLLAGFREQSINIQMTRGKHRQITITLMEGFNRD